MPHRSRTARPSLLIRHYSRTAIPSPLIWRHSPSSSHPPPRFLQAYRNRRDFLRYPHFVTGPNRNPSQSTPCALRQSYAPCALPQSYNGRSLSAPRKRSGFRSEYPSPCFRRRRAAAGIRKMKYRNTHCPEAPAGSVSSDMQDQ